MTKDEIFIEIGKRITNKLITENNYIFNVTDTLNLTIDLFCYFPVNEENVRLIFEILDENNNFKDGEKVVAIIEWYLECYKDTIPVDLLIRYLEHGYSSKKMLKKIMANVSLTEDAYIKNYELLKSYDIKAPKSEAIKLLDFVYNNDTNLLDKKVETSSSCNFGEKTFINVSNKCALYHFLQFKNPESFRRPESIKKYKSIVERLIGQCQSSGIDITKWVIQYPWYIKNIFSNYFHLINYKKLDLHDAVGFFDIITYLKFIINSYNNPKIVNEIEECFKKVIGE